MNHPQPTQPSQADSQVYAMPPVQAQRKQVYDNPADDPDYEPERHCFGYTMAVLSLCISIYFAGISIQNVIIMNDHKEISALLAVSWLFEAYFWFIIFYDPKYCGGKPDLKNSWSFWVSVVIFVIANIVFVIKTGNIAAAVGEILQKIGFSAIRQIILFQDDSQNGWCLCFKPWGFVKKQITPVYPGQQLYGQAPAPSQSGQYPIGLNYGQAPNQSGAQFPNQSVNPSAQPAPRYSEKNVPTPKSAPQDNRPSYSTK